MRFGNLVEHQLAADGRVGLRGLVGQSRWGADFRFSPIDQIERGDVELTFAGEVQDRAHQPGRNFTRDVGIS